MREHNCPDFDYGMVRPGDPAMEFCTCEPISDVQRELAKNPCAHNGTLCCEPGEHHWRPDCDEDNGQPHMHCSHCDARLPYFDEEESIE